MFFPVVVGTSPFPKFLRQERLPLPENGEPPEALEVPLEGD